MIYKNVDANAMNANLEAFFVECNHRRQRARSKVSCPHSQLPGSGDSVRAQFEFGPQEGMVVREESGSALQLCLFLVQRDGFACC